MDADTSSDDTASGQPDNDALAAHVSGLMSQLEEARATNENETIAASIILESYKKVIALNQHGPTREKLGSRVRPFRSSPSTLRPAN